MAVTAWKIEVGAEVASGPAERPWTQGGFLRRGREDTVFGPKVLAPPPQLPRQPSLSPEELQLQALVVRVQAGDPLAFEQLYQRTRDDAARTLFHLVGRRAELEDLLQEVYLRLLKSVKRFRGEARFRTFLYGVCTNVALSHLRWKRRRPEDTFAQLPEQVSGARGPDDEAERRQAARLIEAALEGLTAKKRIVFAYHELLGMGPEEIAQVVGSTPNTVRSRLHHARLEFNDAMQRLLEAPRPGASHGPR